MDRKTTLLIKVGIAATSEKRTPLSTHIRSALDEGVTSEEVDARHPPHGHHAGAFHHDAGSQGVGVRPFVPVKKQFVDQTAGRRGIPPVR
ncbi:MAG: hypothetical protein QGH70_12340 [Nitrospinota bacterium]|nr:hypothetical protein [Nitrospinota bacterium]